MFGQERGNQVATKQAPKARPRVVFDRVGDVFVYVYGTTGAPSKDEWLAVMDFHRELPFEKARIMVYSSGGAPTTEQRAELTKVFGPVNPKTVILTDSTLARAAAVALKWFIPNIRVMPPSDFAEGCQHLRIPPYQRDDVRLTLERLRASVSDRSVAT